MGTWRRAPDRDGNNGSGEERQRIGHADDSAQPGEADGDQREQGAPPGEVGDTANAGLAEK
jgi:hypothetical protein